MFLTLQTSSASLQGDAWKFEATLLLQIGLDGLVQPRGFLLQAPGRLSALHARRAACAGGQVLLYRHRWGRSKGWGTAQPDWKPSVTGILAVVGAIFAAKTKDDIVIYIYICYIMLSWTHHIQLVEPHIFSKSAQEPQREKNHRTRKGRKTVINTRCFAALDCPKKPLGHCCKAIAQTRYQRVEPYLSWKSTSFGKSYPYFTLSSVTGKGFGVSNPTDAGLLPLSQAQPTVHWLSQVSNCFTVREPKMGGESKRSSKMHKLGVGMTQPIVFGCFWMFLAIPRQCQQAIYLQQWRPLPFPRWNGLWWVRPRRWGGGMEHQQHDARWRTRMIKTHIFEWHLEKGDIFFWLAADVCSVAKVRQFLKKKLDAGLIGAAWHHFGELRDEKRNWQILLAKKPLFIMPNMKKLTSSTAVTLIKQLVLKSKFSHQVATNSARFFCI